MPLISGSKVDLESLLVSQDGVHTASQIPSMIEFVFDGGIFNSAFLDEWAYIKGIKPSPLIKITEFPDGLRLLQDGHHRCIAIYLGERKFLYPEEYVVEHWGYDNYAGINFVTGWVTPYNPKTEIRVPDFRKYKTAILDDVKAGKDHDQIKAYIRANPDLYRKPRNVHTIMELAHSYLSGQNGSHQSSQKSVQELLVK